MRTFRENYVEIVEHCACDYYGSRASQLKCLDALEDADGELLKTLELYLRSSRRPAAVAEALGLHRNTVINRIRKAEGAAGAVLTDSGLGSALLTGLEMRSHAAGAEGRPTQMDNRPGFDSAAFNELLLQSLTEGLKFSEVLERGVPGTGLRHRDTGHGRLRYPLRAHGLGASIPTA